MNFKIFLIINFRRKYKKNLMMMMSINRIAVPLLRQPTPHRPVPRRTKSPPTFELAPPSPTQPGRTPMRSLKTSGRHPIPPSPTQPGRTPILSQRATPHSTVADTTAVLVVVSFPCVLLVVPFLIKIPLIEEEPLWDLFCTQYNYRAFETWSRNVWAIITSDNTHHS